MRGLSKSQSGFSLVEGALIILVLALIGLGGYYVYHSQKKSDTATTSSVVKPAESTAQTAASQYVEYKGGIAILSASDVSKLTGAGSKLKAYFVAALPNSTCTPNEDLCPSTGVIVNNTVSSTYGNFAVVSVPDAYEVVGPDPVSGKIVTIVGGQDSPLCSKLKQLVAQYKIPSGFYTKDSFPSCYVDENSTQAIPYASYKG